MKKSIAMLAAMTALCSTAAFAGNSDRSLVTAAQDQLNRLGYDSGHEDGVVGVKTRSALMDFQRNNGLAATGTLNPDTYAALGGDGRYYYGRYNYGANYRPSITWNGVYQNVAWQNNTNWSNASTIPVRFGAMTVADTVGTSGLHNYTVSLNGQPVLYAMNQPTQLLYSHNINGALEDNLVFNVYDAASSCNTKSYTLSIRSNGTYVPTREIASCGNAIARLDTDGRYYVSSLR